MVLPSIKEQIKFFRAYLRNKNTYCKDPFCFFLGFSDASICKQIREKQQYSDKPSRYTNYIISNIIPENEKTRHIDAYYFNSLAERRKYARWKIKQLQQMLKGQENETV